jgi:hypothetical protein
VSNGKLAVMEKRKIRRYFPPCRNPCGRKEVRTIYLEKTKRGEPALWESGGGATSTGHATIIALPDGKPPRALYVARGGHLSNGRHALILVIKGFMVVTVQLRRGDLSYAKVEEIGEISPTELYGGSFIAETRMIAEFETGEWQPDLPATFSNAVKVAIAKARVYHCRSAMFIEPC